MIDVDFADDLALLTNTLAHAESQPHCLEQPAEGNGLYVNAKKIEHMCYKQKGAISTKSGRPLKLVDQFTYLDSSISSTESDVSIRLPKG